MGTTGEKENQPCNEPGCGLNRAGVAPKGRQVEFPFFSLILNSNLLRENGMQGEGKGETGF